MSYILDALRKAERERNAGQAQPLAIVTQGGAPQIVTRRPWWPWALAGLCATLALAAVIALLIRHRQTTHASAPAAPPAAVVARGETPAPPLPADTAEIPAEDVMPDDEAPPIDESDNLQSLDDVQAARTPPPAGAVRPLKPVDAGAAADDESADDGAGDDNLDASGIPPDEAVEPSQPAVGAPAQPATPPPPATTSETIKLEPAPGPQAKLLKEMPSSFRADFPRLTVEVHVYDAAKAKRWVIINSRRYREGETLTEGPRIAEIVRDGIVFEYRGERVLYPR